MNPRRKVKNITKKFTKRFHKTHMIQICVLNQKMLSLQRIFNNSFMKPKKKTPAEQEAKTPDVEVKKSKITLYWEDRERRGIPKGAVLK